MSEAPTDLLDLASERLGAGVVAANDEFFAPKESLLRVEPPIWREGEYTDRGKWMDGWETRRRRDVLPGEPGFDDAHDWCILRLGARGVIRGVDIETTHFKGNSPESCAIEACVAHGAKTLSDLDRAVWRSALDRSALRGDSHNVFDVAKAEATHVRLRIFPDGGVARLRVYGDVLPDWDALRGQREVDLAAVLNGGRVVAGSDMFFGSRHNLIMPGPARGMSDGWETMRRRTAGHDWTVIRLGAPGAVRHIEVDTRHFKGNAPHACSLDACVVSTSGPAAWDTSTEPGWVDLLPRRPLQADHLHTFDAVPLPFGNITHVRLNIFPDGGVGRLRLFGRPA
jgi:allantoicase